MAAADRSGVIQDWTDYPVGVVRELQELGIELPPFTLKIGGKVPPASGLSSSVSIEVAIAVALLAISGKSLPAEEIAVLCQRAEKKYLGSPCGIMDQFVITAARAEHALLLNTRDLTYEHLPSNRGRLTHCCIVVANSMVNHSIAGGDYGLRRRELESGQSVLRDAFPALRKTGDATLSQLAGCESESGSFSVLTRCLGRSADRKSAAINAGLSLKSGAGFGAGLYLYLVRLGASQCSV
jgi:galactokinase